MNDQYYSLAQSLLAAGRAFATALVTRAERPTSGKPGDKAIVTPDGVMHGWIGGSCAQPTVIEEAMKALADGEPRLIRLSADPAGQARTDGVTDLPLACYSGGTLEIFIEPQRPLPRLLIVGGLPIARSLARLGQVMKYQVVVVDPEAAGSALSDLDVSVVTDVDALANLINPLTYVVVASHGNYDEVALVRALRSTAAYVGLIASRKRRDEVLNYLEQQGLSLAQRERLVCPAGLNLGARHGDEIALSVMAEIVQRRRQAERLDPAWLASLAEGADAAEAAGNATETPVMARDPVCGMDVAVAEARFSFNHEGRRYVFCCAGCQTRFAADPAAYVPLAS